MNILKRYYIDLIGLCVLAGVTIAASVKLQSLPDAIPLHWNYQGIVDHHAQKYWIFIGSITSAVVYVVMSLVLTLTLGMTRPNNMAGESNSAQMLIQRGYTYMGLLKLPLMMLPLCYTGAIAFFYPHADPLPIVVSGSLLCILVAAFALIKLIQNVAEQKGTPVSIRETLLKYIGYYDPQDPRVFVEKRFGIGMTVNFATVGGKIFLWVFILIPFLTLFGMAVYVCIK